MTDSAKNGQFTPTLPPSARDVHRHEEQGQDRLVLLAFSASAADAEKVAAAMISTGLMPDLDPGLAYLGDGKPWWITKPPSGSRGGEATDNVTGTVTKLVIGPEIDGRRQLWIARFSL